MVLFGLIAFAAVPAASLMERSSVRAQSVDCNRLQAQIADAGQGGANYAKAARRQSVELERTQAYAHQLGCDRGGFSFFGGSDNPQCPNINARIQQMQANLGQLQGGGGGRRDQLVARYNAYCRGVQEAPRARGFFESIFGSPVEAPQQVPVTAPPTDEDGGDETGARGGSQAVCVRSCDGGFFPLAMSARHKADSLNEMCAALCPGTEATVYTRGPNADIKTAVGLDGKPYMDMPNALKFQKDYTPSCSCHPAGKSWAEALANAEEILGSQRKGDILVTQEKSDELSRPKLDDKTRASLLQSSGPTPGPTKVTPETAGRPAADPRGPGRIEEVTGPDGVKRLVRRVGPQP